MLPTPATVISGKPYPVIEVRDHAPSDLGDFLGETSLVIDLDGDPYPVRGCGAIVGTGVHVHEKDVEHGGKDVRVWAIHVGPACTDATSETFTAEHVCHAGPPGSYFE